MTLEMKYKANVAKYEQRDEERNNVIICNIKRGYVVSKFRK